MPLSGLRMPATLWVRLRIELYRPSNPTPDGPSSNAMALARTTLTAMFATVEPPKRFDARETRELARHVDWAEFHEELLSSAMERMAAALVDAGLDGVTGRATGLAASRSRVSASRLRSSSNVRSTVWSRALSPTSRVRGLSQASDVAGCGPAVDERLQPADHS